MPKPIPVMSGYDIPVTGDDAVPESLSYAAEKFHTTSHMPAMDAADPEGGWGLGAPLRTLHAGSRTPTLGNDAKDSALDSTGPSGKKFTEDLHERDHDGHFIPSSNRKHVERTSEE